MTVLNAEPTGYSKRAIELWQESGFEYYSGSWSLIDQVKCLPAVEILIIRLARVVDHQILDKFPNLKKIVTATTGHDHVDVEELTNRGIELVSLRGEKEFLNTIPSTAEHTWALLLCLLRRINDAQQHVKNGFWDRDLFIGTQLKGKSIGIIGMGRTGKKVSEYAQAFDMKITYYDPDPYEQMCIYGNRCESINELLLTSDIISFHVHLLDSTRHLINKSNAHLIKQGAYLINTSRGGIWDEEVVAKALVNNAISGIAVDVLGTELNDIRNSPLWQLQQKDYSVIITPHIGGATHEAMRGCEEFIAKKVIGMLKN